MNGQALIHAANTLVNTGRGLLAIDASTTTCDRRFEMLGIPQTVAARRAYRDLIITTPGLEEDISGVILYDETIRQAKEDGTSFLECLSDIGITAGIKVDTGAKQLAGFTGEKVTEGLDGLRDRLTQYFLMGAHAKWRAVITVGDNRPSRACIEANGAHSSLVASISRVGLRFRE